MDKEKGFVKFWRSWMSDPVIHKDLESLSLWCSIITEAQHAEYEWTITKDRVTLHPGQFISSIQELSDKAMIPKSKGQRILQKFRESGYVEYESLKGGRSRATLFTVVNWSDTQNESEVIRKIEKSDTLYTAEIKEKQDFLIRKIEKSDTQNESEVIRVNNKNVLYNKNVYNENVKGGGKRPTHPTPEEVHFEFDKQGRSELAEEFIEYMNDPTQSETPWTLSKGLPVTGKNLHQVVRNWIKNDQTDQKPIRSGDIRIHTDPSWEEAIARAEKGERERLHKIGDQKTGDKQVDERPTIPYLTDTSTQEDDSPEITQKVIAEICRRNKRKLSAHDLKKELFDFGISPNEIEPEKLDGLLEAVNALIRRGSGQGV